MKPPSLFLSYRRAEIRAFWMVVTTILCATAALVARAWGASWMWSALGVGVLLPGLISRRWFEFGIAGWNKVVRICVAVLRWYVLRVCYYVLFGVIRLAGSSPDLASDASTDRGRSRWMLRPNAPAPRTWAVCLQPVVLLLAIFGEEQQQSGHPSGTYTLY